MNLEGIAVISATDRVELAATKQLQLGAKHFKHRSIYTNKHSVQKEHTERANKKQIVCGRKLYTKAKHSSASTDDSKYKFAPSQGTSNMVPNINQHKNEVAEES